jgi:hypothetical protein
MMTMTTMIIAVPLRNMVAVADARQTSDFSDFGQTGDEDRV